MDSIPRRQALKTLGAAGAGALIGVGPVDAQVRISFGRTADACRCPG